MRKVTYVLQQDVSNEWWDICEYSDLERIKDIDKSRQANFPNEKRRKIKRTITEEVVK